MLGGDSKSVSHHERHSEKGGRVNALAERLAGNVGEAQKQEGLMGDLVRIAFIARTPDLRASEMLMGATDSEGGSFSGRLTASGVDCCEC